MGERLSVEWIVYVGGVRYTNLALEGDQLPMLLEIEHRDNEPSRLTLTVFDAPGDDPFPNYNNTPDPYLEPGVKVEAFARWEDEEWVKMFSGLLVAKKCRYPSRTETVFVALHKAFRLRKRGKVDTLQNVTHADMLKLKAAEEECSLTVHSSAASDPYLNEPAETILQPGEPNWDLMDRTVREGGYITNTIRDGEIVLRVNKSDGRLVKVALGDEHLVSFDIRSEQKRDSNSSRRKGHSHGHKAGKFQHNEEGKDPSKGRNVRHAPAALPKRKRGENREFFARTSVRGVARQLERRGRELTIEFRLNPSMRNEERIELSGCGAQISGIWETEAVTHRMGNTQARTQAACIRSASPSEANAASLKERQALARELLGIDQPLSLAERRALAERLLELDEPGLAQRQELAKALLELDEPGVLVRRAMAKQLLGEELTFQEAQALARALLDGSAD